jgi:hypothetical protein
MRLFGRNQTIKTHLLTIDESSVSVSFVGPRISEGHVVRRAGGEGTPDARQVSE